MYWNNLCLVLLLIVLNLFTSFYFILFIMTFLFVCFFFLLLWPKDLDTDWLFKYSLVIYFCPKLPRVTWRKLSGTWQIGRRINTHFPPPFLFFKCPTWLLALWSQDCIIIIITFHSWICNQVQWAVAVPGSMLTSVLLP